MGVSSARAIIYSCESIQAIACANASANAYAHACAYAYSNVLAYVHMCVRTYVLAFLDQISLPRIMRAYWTICYEHIYDRIEGCEGRVFEPRLAKLKQKRFEWSEMH